MRWLNVITLLLIIVGGVNWGAVALGGHEADLVAALFGGDDAGFSRIVYGLVGLSAIWQLIPFFRSLQVGETTAETNLDHGQYSG
jgi:uncharacterized membrane protein YuzA (DUF378 family)